MKDYLTLSKEFDMIRFLYDMRASEFVRKCSIPIGYVQGYPIIAYKDGHPYLLIPYLRYKVTGEVDKTLVYPIRFLVSYSLKDCRFVGFYDLTKIKNFENFDFSKPVGYFRHDGIKTLSKTAFKEKQQELYAGYSVLIRNLYAIMGGGEKADISAEEKKFGELLSLLLEPSLKPFYHYLSTNFYKKYIAK